MKLYYHKTAGGAEYLTDKYIVCPNGHKGGIFEGGQLLDSVCIVAHNKEARIDYFGRWWTA